MSTPQQPQPDFQPNQYGSIPQPQGQPPLQPGPQPVAKPKRFGFLTIAVVGLVALLLGVAIGGAGHKTATVAGPATTVTVTAPAPAAEASSDEPSDDPTDDTSGDSTYEPKKSDFEISVKTLSKECFGSAGCNLSFRINPSYVGTQDLPTSGEIEVTYEITGLSDPLTNTFTIDSDGTAHFTKEEDGETDSKNDEIGAKVTDVEYTP